MTRALKIENLKAIDKTSVQILRTISLYLADKDAVRVDYNKIALSLNITRETVRKSINRMVKSKILKVSDGKISIADAVMVQ